MTTVLFYTLDDDLSTASWSSRVLRYRDYIHCCKKLVGKMGSLAIVDQAKNVVIRDYAFDGHPLHSMFLPPFFEEDFSDKDSKVLIKLYDYQETCSMLQVITEEKKSFLTQVEVPPYSQDSSLKILGNITDFTPMFKTLGRKDRKTFTLEHAKIRYGTEEIFTRGIYEHVIVTTNYTDWLDLPPLRWKDGHLLTDGKLSIADNGLEGRLSLSRKEGQLSIADEK